MLLRTLSGRRFPVLIALTFACLSLLSAPLLLAQSSWHQQAFSSSDLPTSAFKLISVEITGTKRYSTADVIAATGLRIGDMVHEDDFKSAAQRLGTSGAFSQVSYKYKYSSDGTQVQFLLADSPKFVPAEFDNLVWFPEAELRQKLHASIPLFDGELPLQGDLTDEVNESLQAMISEKGIPAQVDYLRHADPKENRVTAIVFSVSGPDIRIRNVSFDGAGAAEQPLLQAAAKEMNGEVYLQSTLAPQIALDLMPIYLQRGFLKAKFSDPQPRVAQENGQQVAVDVTFSVSPGPQYKLAGLQWSGNKLFPTQKLATFIHLQAGELANAVELKRDLENVEHLYTTKGYMACKVVPQPEMDDANSTVRYHLNVQEGSQYRMGEIDIGGLERHATDRLLLAWTLKNGQPYDSEYLQKYLAQTSKLLPPGHWKTTVHQTLNKDKTVDITLRFDEQGAELQ